MRAFKALNFLPEGSSSSTWCPGCVIFQEAAHPLKTARVVEVLWGEERVADDILGSFDDPLKCLFVCDGAAGEPQKDPVGERTQRNSGKELSATPSVN